MLRRPFSRGCEEGSRLTRLERGTDAVVRLPRSRVSNLPVRSTSARKLPRHFFPTAGDTLNIACGDLHPGEARVISPLQSEPRMIRAIGGSVFWLLDMRTRRLSHSRSYAVNTGAVVPTANTAVLPVFKYFAETGSVAALKCRRAVSASPIAFPVISTTAWCGA